MAKKGKRTELVTTLDDSYDVDLKKLIRLNAKTSS